ncbi:MAG: NUDIX hydrolase [Burkholderiales bacterium]|nr:NUDIX hydrolase [Burkholderiales bacterium]
MANETNQWKPNVTVAAVVESRGNFLLVEEQAEDGIRYNQPAGHLEEGESLLEAVVRETLEESAHRFTPTGLVGVYQYRKPGSAITYLRFAFAGEVSAPEDRPLDTGILRALWMPVADIRACRERHRSPLLMQCVDDYIAGRRYPLQLLHHHS